MKALLFVVMHVMLVTSAPSISSKNSSRSDFATECYPYQCVNLNNHVLYTDCNDGVHSTGAQTVSGEYMVMPWASDCAGHSYGLLDCSGHFYAWTPDLPSTFDCGCHPCLVHGCGCPDVGEGNPLDSSLPEPAPAPEMEPSDLDYAAPGDYTYEASQYNYNGSYDAVDQDSQDTDGENASTDSDDSENGSVDGDNNDDDDDEPQPRRHHKQQPKKQKHHKMGKQGGGQGNKKHHKGHKKLRKQIKKELQKDLKKDLKKDLNKGKKHHKNHKQPIPFPPAKPPVPFPPAQPQPQPTPQPEPPATEDYEPLPVGIPCTCGEGTQSCSPGCYINHDAEEVVRSDPGSGRRCGNLAANEHFIVDSTNGCSCHGHKLGAPSSDEGCNWVYCHVLSRSSC